MFFDVSEDKGMFLESFFLYTAGNADKILLYFRKSSW